MGGCNSCEATAVAGAAAAESAEAAATAKVVLGDGRLQEFAGPARARHVLQKVVGGGGGGFAVCSADDVELGERVAAVGPDEELQAGQLYFLLPAGMLRRSLRAEDMAQLALRASAALVGHAGPLVFPARHADARGPDKQQDNMLITTTTTRRQTTRVPSAKARDFASQLTSIDE